MASEPARTTPLASGSVSVKGANAIDADAFAGTFTDWVSSFRPSISSVTGTFAAGSKLLFAMPAVTVTRSWPENVERANVTDGTAILTVFSEATEAVVNRRVSE